MNLIFFSIQKRINKNGESLLTLPFKTAEKYLKKFQQVKIVFDLDNDTDKYYIYFSLYFTYQNNKKKIIIYIKKHYESEKIQN